MFLRTLYGSRMPQALHPRSDEQAAKYWREDTESSREIARAIEEAEYEDTLAQQNQSAKKALLEAERGARASRMLKARGVLPHLHVVTQLSAAFGAPPSRDEVEWSYEDVAMTSISTQLSPTGLISIAAADIDEASDETPFSLDTVDLARIEQLRREVLAPTSRRTNYIDNGIAKLVGPIPSSSAATEVDQDRRFLSLLRRVNELRSQDAPVGIDDGGLPYPQILALPTFRYALNDQRESLNEDSVRCAVCLSDYEHDEQVRALPCLHFYHRECIDQWLMEHRICPVCKHQVVVY